MSEQTNSITSLEFSKIAQFPTLTPLTLWDPRATPVDSPPSSAPASGDQSRHNNS